MAKEDKEDHSASEPLRPTNGKATSIAVGAVAAAAALGLQRPPQVDLQFRDIVYSVPRRKGKWKEILHGVTGEFRSGRLTAILGPSGAGKTSLLNLLAGRGPRSSLHGRLRVNGIDCQRQPDLLGKLSVCYIPQEFALMPLLSVRETIYVAARLKLPARSRDDGAARDFIIQDVADRLGLLGCMDTLAGHLSGGEKKRLSIAVEMITSPSIMLLDEPTSGLDSASSNQVISLLSSTARSGCTVACTVHQPSSQMICNFDDILVMSQGRCLYSGTRERVLDHFKLAGYDCPPFYNVAEFVLEVVSGQRDGNYERISSKDSMDGTNEEAKCPSWLSHDSDEELSCKKLYAVSCWEQQKILLYRAFLCIARDNTLTNLRIAAHLIVAVLLGVVFYNFGQDASRVQSNIACLFFFAIFLFFANSMPSVQMFPPEAAVFLRENKNNWYSLESYYVTKVLSDLPLQLICPSVFLLIAYYLTGQPLEALRFFQVWLICTLMTMLAQAFGIATGAAFNTHAGMFLVPAFNIPMFLFAGFFLKLGEIPVFLKFFTVISYFRYTFEGMLQAIYLNRDRLPCFADFCYYRKPQRILADLQMPSLPFSCAVFALLTWIVVLHSVTYCLLRWRLYMSKR